MKKIYLFLAVSMVTMMMSSCVLYEKIVYSSKDIQISNPCSGEMQGIDFKIKALIGDKEEQTIILEGIAINRDINKSAPIGKNLVVSDNEGTLFNSHEKPSSYELRTDKKVKFTLRLPGKYVPKRNKKLPIVSFDIDECHIDIRNVPVIWQKIKKN